MARDLRHMVKPTAFVPLEEISAVKNGSAVDTYESDSQGYHYDSAYIEAGVAECGDDVTGVKVKIEEDNDSGFSSPTVAEGGEEKTIAEDNQARFQVRRSKRYLRAVVTPNEVDSPGGGSGEDVASVYVTGLLTNWIIPMPITE